MPRKLKVYLAGPDVFLPDAVEVGRRKKELCAEYGFEGLYPFDNEIQPGSDGERIDRLIYRANISMIGQANFGLVNLTPFRGPSADAGTVFELGMLTGLGKPVFGYTNDPADLLERVKQFDSIVFDPARNLWRDSAGMQVENFGNADNLMIDMALAEGGHSLIRHSALPRDRFRDLIGFEACLRLAVQSLPSIRSKARKLAAGLGG